MSTTSLSMTTGSEPIRISISEAARLFGVSTLTIRRAIREQKILYVVVQGRYKLNFESVLKWSQVSLRTKKKFEENGIGRYVEKWKIKNPLFSPNPKRVISQQSPTDFIHSKNTMDPEKVL